MIYKAFGYGDSTVHYMGNMRMMLSFGGTEIQSIRGSSFSTPTFGSIGICESFESESERLSGTLIYRHRVFLDGADGRAGEEPQLTFFDFIDPEREIFVRTIHSERDFTMKYIAPSYVRKYRFEGYKFDRSESVALNVIPAGTCYFENFYCPEEIRTLICVKGDGDFDGEIFRHRAGYSQIIITAGNPSSAFENMRYALRYWQEEPENNPIYQRNARYWSELTSHCHAPKAESTLVSILARQSAEGAIMASSSVPMADTRAFYPCLMALMSLGLESRAGLLVDFYRRKLADSRSKGVHTYYGICDGSVLPDINRGRSAASALRALTYYYGRESAPADARRLMKDLFYICSESIVCAMVPFSSAEEEFTAGVIPRESVFQGSLSATVEVILACREFLALAKQEHIKLRDMASLATEKLDEAEKMLAHYFSFEGRIVANSLALEGVAKRPRYLYAKCPSCERDGSFALLTWLDRDKYGRYLCPACLKRKDIPDSYSVDRIFSIAPVCELLLSGLAPEKEEELLEELSKRVSDYLNSGESLPARSAREDVLVSDVLHKYSLESAEYDEQLDFRADSAGTLPEYYVGERCMGSQGDSYPTSLYLLNLIGRSK